MTRLVKTRNWTIEIKICTMGTFNLDHARHASFLYVPADNIFDKNIYHDSNDIEWHDDLTNSIEKLV